ncbi:hypothetical protein J5N97_010278 [Dioscorea zingiberensis]|uniref:Uncharacterized protein n=1 Tax=Dioscorea zingiberensis TaxID=325984 RepID=A0A9D5HMJ0_9LILI|nr:hypothetical protein J5N97_010278 [Dioscorea zingiberensis]
MAAISAHRYKRVNPSFASSLSFLLRENAKDDLRGLEKLYRRLQEANEESKTVHNTKAMKELHAYMDSNIEQEELVNVKTKQKGSKSFSIFRSMYTIRVEMESGQSPLPWEPAPAMTRAPEKNGTRNHHRRRTATAVERETPGRTAGQDPGEHSEWSGALEVRRYNQTRHPLRSGAAAQEVRPPSRRIQRVPDETAQRSYGGKTSHMNGTDGKRPIPEHNLGTTDARHLSHVLPSSAPTTADRHRLG